MNPCSHPIFYMNGVRQEVLKAILDYMYLGEVRINQEDLPDFLKIADEFKIRGVSPVSTKIFPTLNQLKLNEIYIVGVEYLKTAYT